MDLLRAGMLAPVAPSPIELVLLIKIYNPDRFILLLYFNVSSFSFQLIQDS